MPFRQIQTAGIADDAINSAKIGVDVIVAADLAANSVTVSEITDGAVTAAKLAPGAAVPDQSGHSGQFLTTDGTTADWASVDGAKEGVLWENSQTLANSYSIPNGKSAVTAGPVTLGSGVTVTLGATSRWVLV
tara:strand:+ start:8202 stop:8600 length:399 start_codon:yes stop_codon:yes gene_type:complete